MELIDVDLKRRNISSSFFEDEWKDLETLLFERLVEEDSGFHVSHVPARELQLCETSLVIAVGAGADSDCQCNKLEKENIFQKCAGCLCTVYCSKQCQKLDWTSYGYRDECKVIAEPPHRRFVFVAFKYILD